MYRTYQPKKRQRSKVHGFRARMKTKTGRAVLKARRLRGRKVLFRVTGDGRRQRASLPFRPPLQPGRNKHFQYVYRRGKSFPGKLMVLVYLKARDVKVGFSVSAKVGNSVVRNRIRRCLREDFRMRRPFLVGGKYIFVAGAPRPGRRTRN